MLNCIASFISQARPKPVFYHQGAQQICIMMTLPDALIQSSRSNCHLKVDPSKQDTAHSNGIQKQQTREAGPKLGRIHQQWDYAHHNIIYGWGVLSCNRFHQGYVTQSVPWIKPGILSQMSPNYDILVGSHESKMMIFYSLHLTKRYPARVNTQRKTHQNDIHYC